MDVGEGSWSPYRFQAFRMFPTLVICCNMFSQRVVVDHFMINYAIINFRQQMTEERVSGICVPRNAEHHAMPVQLFSGTCK